MVQEKHKIKQFLEDNKEKALEFHKNFYEVIDKVKSYEDLSREIILESDNFVKDDGKLDKNKIIQMIVSKALESKVADLFGTK